MRHQSLTFADIMEPNLLYYDPEQADVCQKICERLRIDFFPSIDGKSKYRKLDDLDLLKKEYITASATLNALPESQAILQARNLAKLDIINRHGISSLVHLLSNM